MALPVTITGTAFVTQNYFAGPFKAPNGQFYVVILESTGGTPEVFMATDPTSSFAAQDASNNPVAAPNSMWATLDGSDLHIATASSGSANEIEYHKFSTATDTWITKDEAIEAPKNPPASSVLSVSIPIRSNGDRIVFYNGDTDSDMGNPYERVDYAFWDDSASSWSSVGQQVNGGSIAEDHIGSIAVLGESDAVHFGWNDDTNGDVLYRRLNSSNSLGTQGTLQGDDRNPDHRVIPSVYYDDDGVERITFGVTNTIGVAPRLDSVIVDDESIDGTPDAMGPNSGEVISTMPVACLAVDSVGKTVYFLGVDLLTNNLSGNSNTDDGGWGSVTNEVSGNIDRVSCNVYPRDGDLKLAFVYIDTGAIKYNEKSLTAPTAPAFTAARLPAQNYKIGPVKT